MLADIMIYGAGLVVLSIGLTVAKWWVQGFLEQRRTALDWRSGAADSGKNRREHLAETDESGDGIGGRAAGG